MLHWLWFCCLKVNGNAFWAAGEGEARVCLKEDLIYILESAPYSQWVCLSLSVNTDWTFFVVEVLYTHGCLMAPSLFVLSSFYSLCWKSMFGSIWIYCAWYRLCRNICMVQYPDWSKCLHVVDKNMPAGLLQLDNTISVKVSFPSIRAFLCWSYYLWVYLDGYRSLAYFRSDLPLRRLEQQRLPTTALQLAPHWGYLSLEIHRKVIVSITCTEKHRGNFPLILQGFLPEAGCTTNVEEKMFFLYLQCARRYLLTSHC